MQKPERQVYKYTFTPSMAPMYLALLNPKVVHVAALEGHGGVPSVWIEIDKDILRLEDPPEYTELVLTVVGTGMLFDREIGVHVGSCVYRDGALVWHVYAKSTTKVKV